MQDKARRKMFKILQESLLKEEQAKYEKSKEEFTKGDDANLGEASYIRQRNIEKVYFDGWDPSDLKYYIEEIEEAKKNASKDFIKVSVKLDTLVYDTSHDGSVEVPHGHWIMGYELSPEQEIKSRAKSVFISAVSNEVHKRYIELNPEDRGRWQMSVSCFLIEAFLN